MDLSKVEHVHSAACVLFKAEIQTLLRSGERICSFRRPKSNRIRQVFKQVGIFDDVGLNVKVAITRDDVIHWEYATGSEINNPAIAAALKKFADKLPSADRDRLLGAAGEALANSVEHAYDYARDVENSFPVKSAWWMFAHLKENSFFVALCDLGCGIPAHLPQKHVRWSEQIRSRFAAGSFRLPDSTLIRVAAEEGVTSTEKSNRGRGLADMLKDLNKSGNASLRVFSNRGMVSWTANQAQCEVVDFVQSISGTVVLLEIRFEPIEVEQ